MVHKCIYRAGHETGNSLGASKKLKRQSRPATIEMESMAAGDANHGFCCKKLLGTGMQAPESTSKKNPSMQMQRLIPNHGACELLSGQGEQAADGERLGRMVLFGQGAHTWRNDLNV